VRLADRNDSVSASPLILVADDDDDIRLLISMRLERAGYRVVTARNGEEALKLAAEHDPDLLVLDVSMPVLNGRDLCIALTADNPFPPPVIFLSGRTMPKDRILGLEAGAVDYMTKPFDAKELVARVGVALRTGRRMATLAHDASVDRMTGLLNRAQLDDKLLTAAGRAMSLGVNLGCVILDLDHFKSINDQFGHGTGDEVLREVAARLGRNLRSGDTVFRYGGEEFFVLVEGGDVSGILVVAEKLVAAIAAEPVAGHGLTASAGAAVWAARFTQPADLIEAADAALYEAKRSGRGRAVLARTVAAPAALAG
jgi:two-component system, cell cycle response regulator